MDAITISVAALAYVVAVATRKAVDVPVEKALEKAYEHIVSLAWPKPGRKREARDLLEWLRKRQPDRSLSEEVDRILKTSSALRRAQMVERALKGARLLWVDDVPENNLFEQEMLRVFGVQIETALTTEEAMGKIRKCHYDLVVSDMARDGQSDAGLELLNRLRESRNQTPVIYYVGFVESSRGTPVGSFGIADRPEPLLHFVLDVLERSRV